MDYSEWEKISRYINIFLVSSIFLGVLGMFFIPTFGLYLFIGGFLGSFIFAIIDANIGEEKFYKQYPYLTQKRSSKITSHSNKILSNDWKELREEVLIRDGYKCSNCGSKNNLHVHHIVPKSRGGSNKLSNLKTVCKRCHKKIHSFMD